MVTELFPKTEIVGMLSPPFSEVIDWRGCCSAITSTGANIVWVSLGSPKQDIVASQISEFLGVRVVAIGAAVDFFSKQKREAPVFIQNLGLEWLFRLIAEPRRLWKRYVLGNTIFLLHLPIQIMKNLLKFGKQ
jgi:N-acetylglucosaminyldiphosphoundecaprenol N-acetyl-beta-D-mannosaminyltransferase